MFQTYIERPVFNLLEFIYAIVPGHDLGIAIIIFTIIIRLLMWPIVRKQLHHAQAMKKLQPELKRIKKEAAGDRQKETRLQMELYKEHEIKPLTTIGTLIIQIPIFIALYRSVLKLINDPNSLLNFSYDWVRDLPWIHHLSSNIHQFDAKFLGLIDLTRYGLGRGGGVYIGAIVLALLSAAVQVMQSRLMLRDQKDARKLSVILKESAAGKEVDQSEIGAAVSRGMMYFLPFVTFIFAINVPSALSLYIMTSTAVGYIQQKRVLDQDREEMQALADAPSVESKPKKKATPTKTKKTPSKSTKSSKKRKR